MVEQQPGVMISLRNEIMTPRMRVDFRKLASSAMQIIHTVQLTRFIINDIEDVFQGDMLSMISLLTNIAILAARFKIVTEAMLINQSALVAQRALMEIAYRKQLVII